MMIDEFPPGTPQRTFAEQILKQMDTSFISRAAVLRVSAIAEATGRCRQGGHFIDRQARDGLAFELVHSDESGRKTE
jgi:hypothetical protein